MSCGKRVAVGLPLYGHMPVHAAIRLCQFLLAEYPHGHFNYLFFKEDLYVSASRNEIVADFLSQREATHVLFLDQDVAIPPDTIERLLAHRRPVVSGVYYQKVAPHPPVAGSFSDDAVGWRPAKIRTDAPLQRVEVIGAGCMMIERKVFEALGAPTRDEVGRVTSGPFDVEAHGRGEDLRFCRKVIAAGFPIYVDPKLDVAHIGTVVVTRDYWKGEPDAADVSNPA